MARDIGGRIPKTIHEKLRSLEDHLFLLSAFLDEIEKGKSAFLKPASATLRLLVCFSSGEEGLIWKLSEILNVNDTVHVDYMEGLHDDLPVKEGLTMSVARTVRLSNGTTKKIAEPMSFRHIIKHYQPIYLRGVRYTYEDIIKSVAQQTGSAHEDDNVSLFLTKINAMKYGSSNTISDIIYYISEIAISFGALIIETAELSECSYKRTHRLPHRIRRCPPHCGEALDIGIPILDVPRNDQGTVLFVLEMPEWFYFGDQGIFMSNHLLIENVAVDTKLSARGFLEIRVRGISQRDVVKTKRIDRSNDKFIIIFIVWNNECIEISVSGSKFHVTGVHCIDPRPYQ